MYAEEQRAESAKVAGMRADNADSHDIQHAVRVSLSDIPGPPFTHASAPQRRWGLELCCGEPPRMITIWSQENVLAEAAMMIPDTRQRLEKAVHELQSTLVSSRAFTGAAARHEEVLSEAMLHAASSCFSSECSVCNIV